MSVGFASYALDRVTRLFELRAFSSYTLFRVTRLFEFRAALPLFELRNFMTSLNLFQVTRRTPHRGANGGYFPLQLFYFDLR